MSPLFLLIAVLAQPPQRLPTMLAIGDLVEDRSRGNQIVEVAGGLVGAGGYSVQIPAAGATPVAIHLLKLKARADAPVTCKYGRGDIVDFSLMNVLDRGMVMRAAGSYCQVKTPSSVSYEEFTRLKLVKPASTNQPRHVIKSYEVGQKVQVLSGGYWLPAMVESFDPATAFYIVRFPDAAQQIIPARGYASAAVLR